MTYLNGNSYEGEWVDNKMEGKGIMNWYDLQERVN